MVMEDTDTEDTEAIMVTPTVMVTMERGLLMPSPPSLLEPAVWCPPPLLSSTTLQPSLPSPTPPTLWPMLDMPPIPWAMLAFLMLDSPWSLLQLLLLRRPWLPRGRRERLTPRSS